VASVNGSSFVAGAGRLYYLPSVRRETEYGLQLTEEYLAAVDLSSPDAVRRAELPSSLTDGPLRVELSPDERLIVVRSVTGTIAIWSARTLELLHVLQVGSMHNELRFSPDGRYGFIELGGHVALVDFSGARAVEHHLRPAPCKVAKEAAFSPDGATIAVGSEHSVCLFDARTRRFLRQTVARRSEPDRDFVMEQGFSSSLYPSFVARGRALFVRDTEGHHALYRSDTGELVWELWCANGYGGWPNATVDLDGTTHLVFGDTAFAIDQELKVAVRTLPAARDVLAPVRPDLVWRYEEPLARALCVSEPDGRTTLRPCPGVVSPPWVP
jgi:WD40 repeat protein